MKPIINIKRAYDTPLEKDGVRILVDRLWPRGKSKEDLEIQEWQKDLAPSVGLRIWFDHRIDRWQQFEKCYLAELENNIAIPIFVAEHISIPRITLIYAAKDEVHNHAVILKEYLDSHFRGN